jgi:hypothetical protein
MRCCGDDNIRHCQEMMWINTKWAGENYSWMRLDYAVRHEAADCERTRKLNQSSLRDIECTAKRPFENAGVRELSGKVGRSLAPTGGPRHFPSIELFRTSRGTAPRD